MPIDPANTLYYRRARFTTRLPLDRLYGLSHYWIWEVAAGRWRIGLTKFATRMLGDLVEHDFSVGPGAALAVGQSIGTVEGFKAVAEVYCVAAGEFVGGNAALNDDPTLLDTDPYDRGWLYEVNGRPDAAAVDAQGYTRHLDTLIDRLLAQSQENNSQENRGDGTCNTPDIS